MTACSAHCIDLTRLARRGAISRSTGIDRVERAYLRHFLAIEDRAVFAVVVCGRKIAVLDRAGMAHLVERLAAGDARPPGSLRHQLFPKSSARSAAEAVVKRLAVAVVSPSDLPRYLPAGTAYVNVGHEMGTAVVFDGIARLPGATATVLIHDALPLDRPEFHRPGMDRAFADYLRVVADHADTIIVPSHAVAGDVARHLAAGGPCPPIRVAPLGVTTAVPSRTSPIAAPDRPYFVTVGTIEPRKNHALLLTIWSQMQSDMAEASVPHLHIVGRRGWRNADVFVQLDTAPVMGRTVFEHSDMDDAALVALIAGSNGLLHPSLAEGFGLPPHEALCLGVRPVCAPLGVYRETLGDAAVYADPAARYQWRNAIAELADAEQAGQSGGREAIAAYAPPRWDAHFKLALTTS